jgi:hypothetical protein
MHCKKNLTVNVIKIIMGEKDGKKVRQDLQALGIQESLRCHPESPMDDAQRRTTPILWGCVKY